MCQREQGFINCVQENVVIKPKKSSVNGSFNLLVLLDTSEQIYG